MGVVRQRDKNDRGRLQSASVRKKKIAMVNREEIRSQLKETKQSKADLRMTGHIEWKDSDV